MLNIQEYRQNIEDMKNTLTELGIVFELESLRNKFIDFEKIMNKPNFWDDNEKATKILKESSNIKATIEEFREIQIGVQDIEVLLELAIEEDDDSLEIEIKENISSIKEKIEKLKIKTYLNGEYDSNNAILSLNAGTGGLDAQDWTQMLLRMYIRWAEGRGFEVKLLDIISDPEAGIKTATILVNGTNAYGLLKSEKGVHRLVRISPYNSSGKRQTSFASVDVMPEIDDSIEVEITQSDLKIDTFRASGAGGQHVNTTDSAVRITHLPTGIVVSCQNERSQLLNKEVAMKMLKSKLIDLKEAENKEKIQDLQGSYTQISWGNQIRSYVFQPYKLVKDTRTGAESGNVDSVMDGNIDLFILEYLKQK
ncbi:MAG: peptide chain release factor 2 [Clostridioides sp.]|nr:peptide chain release factor 2 [Clostridioides sp.]